MRALQGLLKFPVGSCASEPSTEPPTAPPPPDTHTHYFHPQFLFSVVEFFFVHRCDDSLTITAGALISREDCVRIH
jgi:hypothetical protein